MKMSISVSDDQSLLDDIFTWGGLRDGVLVDGRALEEKPDSPEALILAMLHAADHANSPEQARAAIEAIGASGAKDSEIAPPRGKEERETPHEDFGEKHRFGCAMLDMPEEIAAKVKTLAGCIPDADLAGSGRTDEPHITALYGFHDADPEKVRALVRDFGPVRVTLGKTSVFPPSKSSNNADVVKIDVQGEDLHRLHALLAKLPHTDTHPVYRPHITIGYVRAGTGQKYAGLADLDGQEVVIDRLRFCDPEKQETTIPLAAAGPNKYAESRLSLSQRLAVIDRHLRDTGRAELADAVRRRQQEREQASAVRKLSEQDRQRLRGVCERLRVMGREDVADRVEKLAEWQADKHPRDEHGHWSHASNLARAGLEASSVPRDQHEAYHAAIHEVAKRIPAAGHERITRHLKAITVHPSTATMTDHLAGQHRGVGEIASKGGHVRGLYDPTSGTIHGNGPIERSEHQDVLGKKRTNTGEAYAHELMHAIDGPDFELSAHPDWKYAHKHEIAKRGATAPLSHYARQDEKEGLAEFGRLIYGTDMPLDEVEQRFPKASAYIKGRGLWPER